MQIQINFGDVTSSDAISQRVESAIQHSLEHVADRVTRVEVHLHDENADKPGPHDKRVVMEARPAGFDPLAVEHHGSDLYKVIDETAGKLGRAVKHKLERAAAK